MKQAKQIVICSGAALAVACALTTAVLIHTGANQLGLSEALRVTARWSFMLFWLAYTGGALARLFGAKLGPIARHGREFGLSFVAAHSVHLGLAIWLGILLSRPPLPVKLLLKTANYSDDTR